MPKNENDNAWADLGVRKPLLFGDFRVFFTNWKVLLGWPATQHLLWGSRMKKIQKKPHLFLSLLGCFFFGLAKKVPDWNEPEGVLLAHEGGIARPLVTASQQPTRSAVGWTIPTGLSHLLLWFEGWDSPVGIVHNRLNGSAADCRKVAAFQKNYPK